MKHLSKALAVIIVLLLAAVCGTTLAETTPTREVYSGSCGANGDNLTWTLDTSTGVLEISGTGKMKDYYTAQHGPWGDHAASITSIVIGDGVTTISDSAFNGCSSLTQVSIGSGVAAIYARSFKDCSSLPYIFIPSGVTNL